MARNGLRRCVSFWKDRRMNDELIVVEPDGKIRLLSESKIKVDIPWIPPEEIFDAIGQLQDCVQALFDMRVK